MSAQFVRQRLIRFSDCDPAGIVFYPQYFVLFNGLIEDWFDEELGIGYASLMNERRIGLPTVRLEADFLAVSRFGDRVALVLTVERLGRSSITLRLRCEDASGSGSLRMRMRKVIVATSMQEMRSAEIPPDVRAAIETFEGSSA